VRAQPRALRRSPVCSNAR